MHVREYAKLMFQDPELEPSTDFWTLVHQTVGWSTSVAGNVKSIGYDRRKLYRRFGAHGSWGFPNENEKKKGYV